MTKILPSKKGFFLFYFREENGGGSGSFVIDNLQSLEWDKKECAGNGNSNATSNKRFEPEVEDGDEDPNAMFPAKRLRVSDINVLRYEEEFVELKEIASGEFGKVKVARHCLDGIVYAIKVRSRKF